MNDQPIAALESSPLFPSARDFLGDQQFVIRHSISSQISREVMRVDVKGSCVFSFSLFVSLMYQFSFSSSINHLSNRVLNSVVSFSSPFFFSPAFSAQRFSFPLRDCFSPALQCRPSFFRFFTAVHGVQVHHLCSRSSLLCVDAMGQRTRGWVLRARVRLFFESARFGFGFK